MADARPGDTPASAVAPVGRPRASEKALLDAAAAVFLRSGVDAPVREIATKAGVGVGTVYRHFPTRPELVVAVYRHQVEACAAAGPRMLEECATPEAALREWADLFVEFLVTKHGLASALQGDSARSHALHSYFVERLVPVGGSLLEAVLGPGGPATEVDAYSLLKGIGNLCIGATTDASYRANILVQALITGVLSRSAH